MTFGKKHLDSFLCALHRSPDAFQVTVSRTGQALNMHSVPLVFLSVLDLSFLMCFTEFQI